jgi:hypothetical protein
MTMSRLFKSLALAFALSLLSPITQAQQVASGSNVVRSGRQTAGSINPLVERLSLLRLRKSYLQRQLATPDSSSQDRALITHWLNEIDEQIRAVAQQAATSSEKVAQPEAEMTSTSSMAAPSGVDSTERSGQVQAKPNFRLSRPVAGATNEVTELLLAWTEDNPCPSIDCPPVQTNYRITRFIVEIAIDDKKRSDGRFLKPIFVKEVVSDGQNAEGVTVPKETLQSGQKYRWQVLAEYEPQGSAQRLLEPATNAVQTFRTQAQTFASLENKGLTLQRAVAGDDATEGAEFGFLKTFGGKTVYTADFALIYDAPPKVTQTTAIAFRASVQGRLASDDSESEDALQFRAGAVIDRNLIRERLDGLYLSLAAKYETDRKFRVGKFISENMLTPTFPALGIGIPFGRPSSPVQFRWRPFFYFDIGRTFERGDSEERKDTVLRLTPRVRGTLTLNFLRRALNLNDTFLYFDDYFYYLPLEETKKRRNMFSSGFSLQMTRNFGFGLTYKNGESAPRFRRVNTFGGVLTIRFGKEE